MKKVVLLIFLFCFCSKASAQNNTYLNLLIENARNQKLSEHIQWKRLLHLNKSIFGFSEKSLIDEPEFFLAANFAQNPEEELEKTLEAFFQENNSEDKDFIHPQCKYPARYFWLKDKLNFDSTKLIEVKCEAFQEWYQALSPSGLTMIFPTSYLNNPASMFGHTLFRIDAQGQDDKTRLLAYGASYAAGTNESSGLVFAVRGIFGGYLGAFSIAPYYQIVKEYSDLETRDVWEYQLNISQKELELLVRHLWEMKNTYFDYYFFDENCSYHLLSLLDVAKPELSLSDEFKFWAIPIDTVKVTVAVPGLLKKRIYRPSRTTIIKSELKKFNQKEKKQVLKLSQLALNFKDDEYLDLTEEDKIKVLDLAIEYVGYNRIHEVENRTQLEQRELELLAERSKFRSSQSMADLFQNAFPPEDGHKTRLISTALGIADYPGAVDKKIFSEFLLRPAYHDLLSPQDGYVNGSGISFFEFKFREYESENFSLESFLPLKIISLTPRDEFFKKNSFNVQLGATKEFTNELRQRKFFYGVDGGLGLSSQLSKNLILYNFLNGDAKIQNQFQDNYRLGLSYQAGLVLDPIKNWRMIFNAKYSNFFFGEKYDNYLSSIDQRYILTDNTTFNISLKRAREYNQYYSEMLIGFSFYF